MQRLPVRAEHEILRIGQEAVANAAQHSLASTITVHLAYTPTALRLEITDDGRGFDPGQLKSDGTHLGLAGMRERARRIGGVLEITSQPQAGTTVVFCYS